MKLLWENFHNMLKINDLRAFYGPFLGARCGKILAGFIFFAFFGHLGVAPLLLAGCHSGESAAQKAASAKTCLDSLELSASTGSRSRLFSIGDACGERVVAIRSIVGSDTLDKFFVLRDSAAFNAGVPLPASLSGAKVLQVPLKRVAVMSSSQIGYMTYLGLESRIVAVGARKFVADSNLYAKANAGDVAEVSRDGMNVDYEKLVALKPDLVMTFATGGSYDDYDRMEKLGLPVMLTSEWQETTLYAKASWLELYGALFGVEDWAKKADLKEIGEVFDPCAKQLKSFDDGHGTFHGERPPRVLAGMSYGGVWYAPGGKSYTADLIKRAGGCYLWASDSSRELRLTIEEVIALADSSDLWINPGMFATPEEILAAEPRAAYIKAFRERRVFQNDGRKGPGGANDFFESAVARPKELVENLGSLISEKKPISDASAFEWYHNIF